MVRRPFIARTGIAFSMLAMVTHASSSAALDSPQSPIAPSASTAALDDAYGRLVSEALSEYDGGRFEEAVALFEQAYALRPSARAKRGIAKALFELRAYVRCINAIDEALAGTVDPLPTTLRSELRDLRERAMRFVGRVIVVVTPPRATVLADGRPLSPGSDGALVLDVGPHVLEATAPDFQPARRSIDVRGGDLSRLTITLDAIHGAVSPADAPSHVVPVALLVGAGALAIAGVIASSVWFVDRNSAADRCVNAAQVGARCQNADSVVFQRNAAVATITLSSAAVVASGVALFFTLRDRPRRAALGCGGGPSLLSCAMTRTW